eukprot:1125553-Lingulodinium_polyedra.AAC.1
MKRACWCNSASHPHARYWNANVNVSLKKRGRAAQHAVNARYGTTNARERNSSANDTHALEHGARA